MLTIDKKFTNKINRLKKLSESNTDKEAKMFEKLCSDMNIEPNSNEGDCLFDHIFNDCDWTVEYK